MLEEMSDGAQRKTSFAVCIGSPEYRIELEDLAVGLRVVKREEKREKDFCATVERGCYTVN